MALNRTQIKHLGWLILATIGFLYIVHAMFAATTTQIHIGTAETVPLQQIVSNTSDYMDETVNVTGRVRYSSNLYQGFPRHYIDEDTTSLPLTRCPADQFITGDNVLVTVTVTNITYLRTLSPEEVRERAENPNVSFRDMSDVVTPENTTALDCVKLRERLSKKDQKHVLSWYTLLETYILR